MEWWPANCATPDGVAAGVKPSPPAAPRDPAGTHKFHQGRGRDLDLLSGLFGLVVVGSYGKADAGRSPL
jgi:hypothetical protein